MRRRQAAAVLVLTIAAVGAVSLAGSSHRPPHHQPAAHAHPSRQPASTKSGQAVRQHRPRPSGSGAVVSAARHHARARARRVALSWILPFARGLIACLYAHQACSRIPGLLPSFAGRIEPQLASRPVTGADLRAHPWVVSVRVRYGCPVEAVATITYGIDQHVGQLHADLADVPDGWRVFAVPELPGPVLLPASLRPGQRLC